MHAANPVNMTKKRIDRQSHPERLAPSAQHRPLTTFYVVAVAAAAALLAVAAAAAATALDSWPGPSRDPWLPPQLYAFHS